MKTAADGGCDLAGSELIDGDGVMSLAIEGEAKLVAGLEAGVIREDGAGGFGALAAKQEDGQGSLEMDEAGGGVGEQGLPVTGILYGAATEAEDKIFLRQGAEDGLMLGFAEPEFAAFGEELGDGDLVGGFDIPIDVEEVPVQLACEEGSYG